MVSFFVPPELLFSLTQRCWLSDGMWVTEEEGGGLPPLLDFGHLIRFHGFPSSYGALWCPDDFLLKNKFSILFCLGVKVNGIRAGRWSLHCIKSKLYLAKWKWILRSGPKLKMLVKFHRSNGSFPNPLNWWRIRFGCTALDQCYWNKENWFANWKSTMHFSDLHILGSTMPLIIEFFIKIKSQFGRFWGQTRIIILSLP